VVQTAGMANKKTQAHSENRLETAGPRTVENQKSSIA
jgi:hypothetical protein